MSTNPQYDPNGRRWNSDVHTIEMRDGEYGDYVRVETPRMVHRFAVIDGTVICDPNVDESVIEALEESGHDVST